jgi:hypothetical protein
VTRTPALTTLAREDRRLEEAEQSTVLALMEHRWRAVKEYGYSLREYGQAVGRSHRAIGYYVKAWELHLVKESFTPAECLERVQHGEDRATAIRAVADLHGVGMASARQRHMPEVRRVQAAIADEPTPHAKEQRAARYVETVRKSEQNQRDRQERHRRDSSRSLLQVEVELDRARRALRQAVGIARDAANIDEQWQEQLNDMLADCEVLLGLLNAAIVDASAVDWDSELQGLTGEA